MQEQDKSSQTYGIIQNEEIRDNIITFKSKQQIEKELKEKEALKLLLERSSKLTW